MYLFINSLYFKIEIFYWSCIFIINIHFKVLSMTLLINQDLRTSVSSARLEVQNSTIKYEYDDTQGSFSQKVLEEFKRQDGAEPQHLPYTTVNAVIKEGDNPFSVDDFRSGGNIQS